MQRTGKNTSISRRELRRRRLQRALSNRKSELESLEQRELLTVSTFQNGVGGYSGQGETVLYSREPGGNFGGESSMSPDQQDANGVRQGLLRFDDIIGSGEIPLGAKINSATFNVNVINDSNSAMQMSLYRLQVPWDENIATWNSFGEIGGIQTSEGEASALPPDGILFQADTSASGKPGTGTFDVTRSLEYWATGANNYGWLIESAATNGWDYTTSESANAADRPKLTVDWTVPAENEFKVLSKGLVAEEGSTVSVDIARFGDLSGEASVEYSITAGTAGADDFVATSGTITFEAGEAFTQIDLETTEDDTLEGDETVVFSLGEAETTIKIGDDDALINEVFANVSNSSVDESNKEYIELIGTPGASLDGYSFVVFEGEEEEVEANAPLDGAGAGVADFVFDLSGHTFGDNGLLVIAPTTWDFADLADPDTNIVNTDQLDGEGGVLEDYSQTYALVRGILTQGIDYDTEGTCEDETNQAICEGVGILDQLGDAQIVDSVGTVEGGGSDRDRTLTTPDLNHPGVHVHQPERNRSASANGVTSDAISRRLGETQPNSIGIWFNGDILDADPAGTLAYANDTFWTSVVTPDGAVLTPGAHNQLRTVHFSLDSQAASVAEVDGSVTLTINRVGAAGEEVTIQYRTFDSGTATGGEDYVVVEDSITFSGDSETITLDLLADTRAEGFENFAVEITSVTEGYLITNGRPTQVGAVNGRAIVTIVDGDVELGTFQDDVNGYEGTSDAHIDAHAPEDKFGQDLIVRVDNNKGEFGDEVFAPQQGLLRFDDVFGSEENQVPAGSTVFSGFITLNVVDGSGGDVALHRLLQDWDQVQTSWSDPQGDAGDDVTVGFTPNDLEAVAIPDAVVPDASQTGKVQVPLSADTLQSWANGSLDNFGWLVTNSSGELFAFSGSEAFALDGLGNSVKPELTVVYNPPQSGDVGNFSFSQSTYEVAESAGSVEVVINRFGGTSGSSVVDWTLDGADDDVGSVSGSVSFADGELFKTVNISIVDDTILETNESFTLSIEGDEAALVIRDNDFNPEMNTLLLNEMFINSPGNDPPSEYIEITGDAGLPLGSMYYVAVEGEAGDSEGLAEKVIDLGAFQNGTNGITILTPDAEDFAYNVTEQATQIDLLGSIATENVSSANNTTTFMLIYSPEQRLTSFDYDWNNDGELELPASAVIIDSVAFDSSSDNTDLTYVPGGSEVRNSRALDVDALSRRAGNTTANESGSWYGGDLVPAGDDYITYEASESFGVPSDGTMTPGEPNTPAGATQATVGEVAVDASGVVTVSFSAPISQVMLGLGNADSGEGAGITISGPDGAALATVDAFPATITGYGTDTLSLTFSGSGTVDGVPPAGDYQLNIVGNGLVSNGLTVDTGGTTELSFAHPGPGEECPLRGDLNGDCTVDFSDFLQLSTVFGQDVDPAGSGADIDGNGTVDFGDFLILSTEFGQSAGPVGAAPSVNAIDAALASLMADDEEV